jgi:hypothetical protein
MYLPMFKRFAISRRGDMTVSCEWANIGFDFSIRARSGSVGDCDVVFNVTPTVTETGVLECPTTYHTQCESLGVSGALCQLLRQTQPFVLLKVQRTKINFKKHTTA